MLKAFGETIKRILEENKVLFLIVISILLSIGLAYILSKQFQTNFSLTSFRKFPQYTIQYRTDYNSSIYKNHALRDFHIFSASQPLLTRLTKYDYISLEMLEEIIKSGARYIEFTILGNYNTSDGKVQAVISIGKKEGNTIQALNTLSINDVFGVVAKHAFSKSSVINYTDPLFLYLDVQSKDNNVLDHVSTNIKLLFNDKLLPPRYENSAVNLANEPIGIFMEHIIFLSNISGKDSSLGKYINMNHELPTSNLKRLHYSDLLEEKKFGTGKSPDFFLQSKHVEFSEQKIGNPVITIHDSQIDLPALGLNEKMNLTIHNSRANDTNTSISIQKVYKNKIILYKDDKNKIVDEQASHNVKLYGHYTNNLRSTIEDFNKKGLTIVVPDENILPTNYNPKNMWYLGCQFVTLYFQNIDENWKIAKYFFRKRALRLKQSSLLSPSLPSLEDTTNNSIEVSKFPDPVKRSVYPIDYNLLRRVLGRKIIIEPHLNKQLIEEDEDTVRCVIENVDQIKVLKMSSSYNNINSEFSIMPSINYGQKGTVIISTTNKNGDVYFLTANKLESGKYSITFEKTPCKENQIMGDHPNTEFYLLQSSIKDQGYYQIGFVETEKQEEGENKLPKDILYKLTFNDAFRPSDSLDVIETYEYNLITGIEGLQFKKNEPPVWIWRPKSRDGYYSIGDVVTPVYEKPKEPSKLVSGAVLTGGFDYELIWSNSSYELEKEEPNLVSMWKPVPIVKDKKEYVGFGVVTTIGANGLEKPNPLFAEIAMVEKRFTKEAQFTSNTRNSSKKTSYGRYNLIVDNNSYVSFWKGGSHSFCIPKQRKSLQKVTPPDPYVFPVYEIYRFEDTSVDSKLHLQRDLSDDNLGSFKIAVRFDETTREITDEIYTKVNKINLSENEGFFKIQSSMSNENDTKRCVSMPNSYWSSIYQQLQNYSSKTLNNEKKYSIKDELYLQVQEPENTGKSPIINLKTTKDNYRKIINNFNASFDVDDTGTNRGTFSMNLSSTKDDDYTKYLNNYGVPNAIGNVVLPLNEQDLYKCEQMGGRLLNNQQCEFSLTNERNEEGLHVIGNTNMELPKGYQLVKLTNNNIGKDRCAGRFYNEGNKCEYGIVYPTDVHSDLEMNVCREENYFSTNFIYSTQTNAIHPLHNISFCLYYNKNSKTSFQDTFYYPVFLKSINKLNQDDDIAQFYYDKNLQVFFVANSDRTLCLTAQANNKITVQPYIKGSTLQIFPNVKTYLDVSYYCIKEQSTVLVKIKERRERDKYNKEFKYSVPIDNLLKEYYDDTHFHMWITGSVEEIVNGNYRVNIGTNGVKEIVEVSITSSNIIPKLDIENDLIKKLNLKNDDKKDLVKPGTRVVAKNGGFRRSDTDTTIWTENKVFWEGIILEQDPSDESLYTVIFSIQSIEPNLKNKAKERPSSVQIRSMKLQDMYLLRSGPLCNNFVKPVQ